MNTKCNCSLPPASQTAAVRKGLPNCNTWAVIPSYTVATKENLAGIKDAFVHVESENTTYYINNLHQAIITWKGPLFIDNYDYQANPDGIRDNVVYDKAENHIIVYDHSGAYALYPIASAVITDDFFSLTSVNPVQNKTITAKVNELTTSISNEVTARTTADSAIRQEISDEATRTDTLVASEATRINSIVNDSFLTTIGVSSSASTDTLNLTDSKKNILTKATSTQEIPMPVASSSQAGVMNSATYNALQDTVNKVNIIENATVAIDDLPADVTQAQLTLAWETAAHTSTLLNGAKIYDKANLKIWTYYSNSNEWVSADASGTAVEISQWTNNAAGIVRGSEVDGQIFAEADGTGSVNGWDAVKSDIANNTTAIANKQDALNTTQLAAVNSGITSDKVTTYDGYGELIGDVETILQDINSGNGGQ